METSLKNRLRILSNHFAIIQSHPVTKKKEFMLEPKRGGHARVQTEMVELIALSFPSSNKKLKIWSFHVVVVQGRQRNVVKSVLHVQSCRCRRRRSFVRSLFYHLVRTGLKHQGSQMLSPTRWPLVDTASWKKRSTDLSDKIAREISAISEIQLLVYYQCRGLIGWADY